MSGGAATVAVWDGDREPLVTPSACAGLLNCYEQDALVVSWIFS